MVSAKDGSTCSHMKIARYLPNGLSQTQCMPVSLLISWLSLLHHQQVNVFTYFVNSSISVKQIVTSTISMHPGLFVDLLTFPSLSSAAWHFRLKVKRLMNGLLWHFPQTFVPPLSGWTVTTSGIPWLFLSCREEVKILNCPVGYFTSWPHICRTNGIHISLNLLCIWCSLANINILS